MMDKPDADGYVYVKWPSKTIPHGGIFHTRVVRPTSEQQQFLKVLQEEAKLSLEQRRKNAWALRRPDEKPVEPPPRLEETLWVRPRTSRRRSLSEIRQSGVYESENFFVKPLKRGEDRERLKDKLANTMAFGDTDQKPPAAPRIPKPAPKLPTDKEQWQELVTQIRERAEWLAEMEALGHAGPHREVIQDQIAERLRALNALGVDPSECMSVRSGRSKESSASSVRSRRSSVGGRSTMASQITAQDKPRDRGSARKSRRDKEENINAYEELTPLRYSPRRRV